MQTLHTFWEMLFYNENGNWTEKEEGELISLLRELNDQKIYFALSNIIEKQNPKQKNELLENWVFQRKDLHIFDIDYHYRSSSYNKKNRDAREREILITNFQV